MEYSLGAVPLRLTCVTPVGNAGVPGVLASLFSLAPVSFSPFPPDPERGIQIVVHASEDGESPEREVSGEVVFDAPGLSAIRTANGYHLRSHGSFLALDLRAGRAAGSLSAAFMNSPLEDQRGLFFFALLLLFAARGLYGLHAGGVSRDGCGFLLVGGSGCGKTTLTCALARSGWQYLSDDSVLLRRGSCGVEALAFGRPFNCAPAMFRHFPELGAGIHYPAQRRAGGKRLVDVTSVYPGRFSGAFQPRVILFPEIAGAPASRLIPLSGTETLLRLLKEGAGLLHNRDSMTAQMSILRDLACSTRGFRLLHGADVHRDPSRLSELLRQIANPPSAPESVRESVGDYIDAIYSAA
jgi:hypothetical protein